MFSTHLKQIQDYFSARLACRIDQLTHERHRCKFRRYPDIGSRSFSVLRRHRFLELLPLGQLGVNTYVC